MTGLPFVGLLNEVGGSGALSEWKQMYFLHYFVTCVEEKGGGKQQKHFGCTFNSLPLIIQEMPTQGSNILSQSYSIRCLAAFFTKLEVTTQCSASRKKTKLPRLQLLAVGSRVSFSLFEGILKWAFPPHVHKRGAGLPSNLGRRMSSRYHLL